MSFKIIPRTLRLLLLATLVVASCSPDVKPPPSGPVTEELLKSIPEKEPDWVYATKEIKDNELKRKVAVCTDIIEKLLENGFDVLGIEKKYNFINKYGPKKCPDQ